MGTFTEMLYIWEPLEFIMDHFDDPEIEEVNGFTHHGKFLVTLSDDQYDNFYVQMVLNGWASNCFNFMYMARMPSDEERRKILSWMNAAMHISLREN